MARYVFISHSREDRGYALSLAQHLEMQGVAVRVDRDPSGSAESHLADCAAVVLVMTPAAQSSEAVVTEIRQAHQLGRPIVPLLLQGTSFYAPGQASYEDVRGGAMPSPGLVQQLQSATATAAPTSRPAAAAAPGTYAGGQAAHRHASAAPATRVQPAQSRSYQSSVPRQAPPAPRSADSSGGGGGGSLPKIRIPGFRLLWRALLRFAAAMLAIWLTTLLIKGVQIETENMQTKVITLAVVAVLFGVANAVLRPIIKMVGCGLYIMTLGLISFVVNGALLMLVSFVADRLDYPFHVEDFWPSAILGAVVIGLIGWVLNLIIVPKR